MTRTAAKMKSVRAWMIIDPHFPISFGDIFASRAKATYNKKDNAMYCSKARIAQVEIREIAAKGRKK